MALAVGEGAAALAAGEGVTAVSAGDAATALAVGEGSAAFAVGLGAATLGVGAGTGTLLVNCRAERSTGASGGSTSLGGVGVGCAVSRVSSAPLSLAVRMVASLGGATLVGAVVGENPAAARRNARGRRP